MQLGQGHACIIKHIYQSTSAHDLVNESLNGLESPKEAIRTWKGNEKIAFWLLAAF